MRESRRYSFPASSRLLNSADFKEVFSDPPLRSADRYFIFLACPSPHRATRLGLAIAKKRIRHAVQRNRIKRLIRESFRINQTRLKGLDIVAMAREQAADTDNAVLHQALYRHWKRLSQNAQRATANSSKDKKT